MAKEKAEKETEDQKLDRLNNQMEELKFQFRQLLQALKGGGLSLDAESVASLSTVDGTDSKFNTLKKNKNKGNNKNAENSSKRNTGKRGLFATFEDALVNPTALKKRIEKMERSNTLDDD